MKIAYKILKQTIGKCNQLLHMFNLGEEKCGNQKNNVTTRHEDSFPVNLMPHVISVYQTFVQKFNYAKNITGTTIHWIGI